MKTKIMTVSTDMMTMNRVRVMETEMAELTAGKAVGHPGAGWMAACAGR